MSDLLGNWSPERLKAPPPDGKPSSLAWLRHLRPGSFLVYLLPLLLGLTLPGVKITDPNGWLVGFWRIPFVALIVLAQAVSFVVGWVQSSGIIRKILAATYIVLMSFWLVRDYFFGVEADFVTCARLFLFCFLPTFLMDAFSSERRERARWQQRND